MTSNTNINREEQHARRREHNDGNTSDDSLLLMADDAEDKTPLLNNTDDRSVIRQEILTSQSQSPSTHCHVPDDNFDFGARNRLFITLIICIIFMIIEIGGMSLD